MPHTTTPSRRTRLLFAVAVPLVLLASAVAAIGAFRPATRTAHASGGSLPAGMPSHFSFGLMDAPGDASALDAMRTHNGTAWDYRYQYLAGGVNTGSGWSTWNQPSGAFAQYYVQDSQAHGYRPAFVYYNMFQSRGPAGSGEAGTDLAHLADPTTMHAYYADWTLLMQQIAASAGGQPVLIIVEPDLWGYIEQAAVRAGSNNAASVPASVASSGTPALAGLPNTAQGFALALLALRAQYAPHAVLALHSSPWGTGTDLASNTSATLDAAGLGTQTAQFLRSAGLAGTPGLPAGVAPFDVISADIADHDSGQSGIWWDPTNHSFPNFARYLTYANALTSASATRLVLWQVPVGNQVYQTEDNSAGHTQDNKAQYILGHLADFANAGIVGVLFGPGNSGTIATDGRHDGVTNPAPIVSYQCNRCNTAVSIYPDDDGGYLRLQLGQYYTKGSYPLPGGSGGTPPPPTPPTTTPPAGCTPKISFAAGSATPSSAAPGATVALAGTFTASCATTGLVDFEVYNAAGQKVWQTGQDNTSLTGQAQTAKASWTIPATQAAGSYTVKLGVFAAHWGALYGWNGSAATITIEAGAVKCSGAPTIRFGSGGVSSATPARGSSVTLSETLTASCATTGLVDFEVYNAAGQKIWQTWQDNTALTGAAQTFTAQWAIPAGQAPGSYTLRIGVFATGWSAFWAWNGSAAAFSVS